MTLIYVMDPMCSWCYAFQPHLKKVISLLRPEIKMTCYMGGLATDSNQPMPLTMQKMIKQTWHNIEQRTGAQFNYDFWDKCQPRRSTYPACRAVISAEQIAGHGMKMTETIQQAYYRQALNPSNISVLTDLAEKIGIHREHFNQQMQSQITDQQLFEDLNFSRQHGIQGFPFLGALTDHGLAVISAGYCNRETLLQRCTKFNLF